MQLREATPFGEGPKCLIRDNDGKFGRLVASVVEGSGVEVGKIAPRLPNLESICERFLASVRRDGLDHVLLIDEGHLRRVLGEHVRCFGASRPHQGLGR